MGNSKEGLNAPFASALIRKVFPVYLAFAVGLTLVQVGIDYWETRAAVAAELDATAHSFKPVVADALWNYQYYLLPKVAEVILSAGVVTGVDIGEADRLYVTRDPDEKNLGEWSKQVELFHAEAGGAPTLIGFITLYSNHGVVIERVRLGVLLIVVAAAIKTLGLWLIIVFFVRRLLAGPLRRLTDQIAAFDLAQATRAPRVDLGPGQAAELVYLCESFNDLAQRAVTTNKLKADKEAAEAHNLAKSRFLAAASHDLRQPMHALNLYLGSLVDLDLPPRARTALTNARQCARSVDEMFRALLDISRLEACAVQPEVSEFSIESLLTQVWVQFRPEAHAKGLTLHVVNSVARVRSDPAIVERILSNFVSNAVRYTRSGKILIGCHRRGGSLRLAVYDTGVGIPAHKQEAVFNEFYQVDTTDRGSAEGLGLGLAIVKRLAKLLAAPITLHSIPGRGSMFAIDLPLVRGARELSEPAGSVASQTLCGKLIAVVDDEQRVLDATRSLLEHWGCVVVATTSGSEMMERVRPDARVPDVLICDYQLRHGETGVGVVAALRGVLMQDIPALLVTGDTSPKNFAEIQASGLLVLHKPLEEDALKRALLRLLEVPAFSN